MRAGNRAVDARLLPALRLSVTLAVFVAANTALAQTTPPEGDVTAATAVFHGEQRAQLTQDFHRMAEFFDLADRSAPSPAALRNAMRGHQSAGHSARSAPRRCEPERATRTTRSSPTQHSRRSHRGSRAYILCVRRRAQSWSIASSSALPCRSSKCFSSGPRRTTSKPHGAQRSVGAVPSCAPRGNRSNARSMRHCHCTSVRARKHLRVQCGGVVATAAASRSVLSGGGCLRGARWGVARVGSRHTQRARC
jgi:hypothetical protein